jgi:hypothetical protein
MPLPALRRNDNKQEIEFYVEAILVVVCLLLIDFILGSIFPAGLATKATEAANAVLFYPKYTNNLPDEVEITIDAVKASFRKNTKSYNDLLIFMQNGRSTEAIGKAGSPPEDFGPKCGEMKISNYGIPFYFEIRRSNENTNYYRIILPKLTSPGRTAPIFTTNTHIIDLIKTNRIQ